MFDRRKVGRSFHRHADAYDRLASVQQRVVRRLMELLAGRVTETPRIALDIGCGTGALTAALKERYPKVHRCGLDLALNMVRQASVKEEGDCLFVNGDAEHLPFRDGSFDLVVSASTLQWLGSLDGCLRECRRIVTKDGFIALAFFGGATLWELQESYREALARRAAPDDPRLGRLHRFMGVAAVREALARLDLGQVQVTSEIEMDHHPDVQGLLRSIKGIGAGAAARGGAGGLGWRRIIEDMSEVYQRRFFADGMIPATYEVIYLMIKPA
ncbi:methyltransferase domain-containing protein [Geobacter sp. AOG2]|uniref:methyltransferase domain-containing protein n=1 Tax=Geobacter sp. AOG2 TaxID=1566347 RepID=UPI001CC507E3|nr:methyltransferase domain-containing protein [Geobacter sp. AOG2]GFE61319.1 malonyl-[acyl-carrier protein]O-methyltransferase [Geobacter sp. AOG2]